jgi:hypothetical protein
MDAAVLFGRAMQDCINLEHEANHHNDGSEGEAEETKAMLLLIHRHDDKANNDGNNADDHPLIILFSEGKFIFHNVQFLF